MLKAWKPKPQKYQIENIIEKKEKSSIRFQKYKEKKDLPWNQLLQIFLSNQAWFKIRFQSNNVNKERKKNLKKKYDDMTLWFSSIEEPKPSRYIEDWIGRENYRKENKRSFYVENLNV